VSTNYDTLGGYTEDDPEYWVLMAKIIGNPLAGDENSDDSEFLDENGTVVADDSSEGAPSGDA
jgi:hypothetical protein